MILESLSVPNSPNNVFSTVEICVAKDYHECTFQVEIGERFVAMQEYRLKGRAFKSDFLSVANRKTVAKN